MISKHGGDIEVKSKLGEGSTFILIFPIKKNNNKTIKITANKALCL